MKKSRYLIAGLLMLSLLLCFGGCGPAQQREIPEGHILITDCLGREVWVPQNPQYIASLFAPGTHIIGMLGGSENVVAINEGVTRDILFVEIYPAILEARQPRVSAVTNIEELFKDPAPQVIFVDASTINDAKMMENLERFGVPVVAVRYNSIEELKHAFSMIGEILGSESKAAEYNAFLSDTLEMITGRLAGGGAEKKVVYHALNEILRTDITNTLSGQWIPMMGLTPAGIKEIEGADSDAKHYVSLEQLLRYDPEYIIINGADVYDYIYSDRGYRLHVLQAYKNDNIYLLPMGVTRWAH
ncbi:MAG: ABC transporter substrate-binding protein, partial [Clostridiales bacterium]|nr:ABC transporter substrate-binding protein [Clostridiales bacterium]